MDAEVVGVCQRKGLLVSGIPIFFEKAHDHVLQAPVVAFRLALGL